MKRLLLFLIPVSMMFAGCGEQKENPFFAEEYNTPFEVPPFDEIDDEHFLPAIEEGIKRHKAEIDAIINNPEEPTFENTIVAYDKAGDMLSRVNSVFGGIRSAETNSRLQEIARETTPMLSAHSNSISMNMDLFERIEAVYEQREDLDLDQEQMRVVEMYYRDFERSGAALSEDDRERLGEINERMSMVSLE
ncbi:MAG: peptidase M3, partial [Bacteroidales bacterium]